MEFLFQNRGAGKRQVKPSQDIALLEDQLGAESSDDSEYRIDSDRERDADDSNDSQGDDESSESSNDDDDDQDDDEAEEDNEEVSEEESKTLKRDQDLSKFSTRDLLTLARQELDHDQLPRWVGSAKICGCCLGNVNAYFLLTCLHDLTLCTYLPCVMVVLQEMLYLNARIQNHKGYSRDILLLLQI